MRIRWVAAVGKGLKKPHRLARTNGSVSSSLTFSQVSASGFRCSLNDWGTVFAGMFRNRRALFWKRLGDPMNSEAATQLIACGPFNRQRASFIEISLNLCQRRSIAP